MCYRSIGSYFCCCTFKCMKSINIFGYHNHNCMSICYLLVMHDNVYEVQSLQGKNLF